jgi:hypothetical protein
MHEQVLLVDLPPIDDQILGPWLHGRNVAHVAEELKLSRQTIHRAINLLRVRMTSMDGGTDWRVT